MAGPRAARDEVGSRKVRVRREAQGLAPDRGVAARGGHPQAGKANARHAGRGDAGRRLPIPASRACLPREPADHRIPRREGRKIYDAPREDAARAIRLLRANAAKFGWSPEKIGAVGFSAGAHLAAVSATSSQDALYDRVDAADDLSPHLNFSVPVYPAYVAADGATGPNTHGGDGAALQPEFKFDAKTPPMFLVHGDKDYYSPMGSVLLYTELHKRKIPAQLFVYANVSHGLGDTVNARGWQQRIVDWIASIGF